jgi:hypothetical protein
MLLAPCWYCCASEPLTAMTLTSMHIESGCRRTAEAGCALCALGPVSCWLWALQQPTHTMAVAHRGSYSLYCSYLKLQTTQPIPAGKASRRARKMALCRPHSCAPEAILSEWTGRRCRHLPQCSTSSSLWPPGPRLARLTPTVGRLSIRSQAIASMLLLVLCCAVLCHGLLVPPVGLCWLHRSSQTLWPDQTAGEMTHKREDPPTHPSDNELSYARVCAQLTGLGGFRLLGAVMHGALFVGTVCY